MKGYYIAIILLFSPIFLFSQDLFHKSQIPFPPLPEGALDYGEIPEPRGRDLYPGLFGHTAPIREVYSHGRNAFAGVSEDYLYVRNADDDEITPIIQAENGWQWDVEAAKWNEEGTLLLVREIDKRELGAITLTDEEGNTRERSYTFMGEPLEKHQYYIVDIAAQTKIKIDHGYEKPFIHAMAWHNGYAYLLQSDRMMQQLELLKVATNGSFKPIITETSDTYIIGLNLGQHYDYRLDDSNVVEFYEDKILWTSERSGYRQIYLYDLNGNLITQLTSRAKNGIVEELSIIANGWAYFSTFDINVGNTESLVDAKFYRVSLESGAIQLITEGPVILGQLWTAERDRFWIMHGDLDHIKLSEFNQEGKKIETTWEYTIKENEEFGFDPEYVWTMARDGKTQVGSAILKPVDFDPDNSYPVVEYIYGPPFYNQMPWNPFIRRVHQLQDLANNGFIIVITDAPGTEFRGRDFNRYTYGRLGQVEIDDHAHALEQLARDRPYMDMTRVGIMGHSMGGYFSLRAMVQRPDLYKVGHINAPNVDPVKFRVPLEPYYGCLPNECPDVYAAATVTDRLDRLEGPMLITFGTADQHIPVSEAYRLTEAMDEAGYDAYELDIYPGVNHLVMRDSRWYPKMVEFFERELKNTNR